MRLVNTDQRGAAVHHERPHDLNVMPQSPEGADHLWWDAILDFQNAGVNIVVREAQVVMQGVEPRRLDGFLGRHTEHGKVQKDLESLLVLAIAARTAERDVWLSVAEDNSWARSRPRTLATPKDIGVSVVAQDEGLHAIAQGDPRIASDEHPPEDPGRRR